MSYNDQASTFLKFFIWSCAGLMAFVMLVVGFPDEESTLLVVVLASGIVLFIIRRFAEEKEFLTNLFLAALVARLAFGVFIHVYDLRDFFGGDAMAYDFYGSQIRDYWYGLIDSRDFFYERASSINRPGWGINYFTAALYTITGRNILAAQSLCGVVGAATAPMVYVLSKKIFGNRKVAQTAALSVAFFPAMVIWSAQLLKDGLIVFLLVLAITMVMHIQERINYAAILVLILSLFCIISLRFYIFYMVAVSIAGSFMIGLSNKGSSIIRRTAVLLLIGFGLTYLGVIRNATSDIERYADLDRIQASRKDLARSAESGFGEEVDISTTEGAITTLPVGFAYLMFAPFPWQAASLRQAITLPETLVWWGLMPFLVMGILYSVRTRLRSTFPMLFFALTLTLAYSIFQGNVGTAYRQRTQIQVFLFIFIAVGWQLWKERREDRRQENLLKQKEFARRLQTGAQHS